MKEFRFTRQTLVEMWANESFTIESETFDDAKRIFMDAIKSGDEFKFSDENFEYLYETAEEIRSELLNENEERIDQ